MINFIICFFVFAIIYGFIASSIEKGKPRETEKEAVPEIEEEHKQSVRAKDMEKVRQLTDIANHLSSYIDVVNVTSPQADRGGEWFIIISLLDNETIELYYDKNADTSDLDKYINDELGLTR